MTAVVGNKQEWAARLIKAKNNSEKALAILDMIEFAENRRQNNLDTAKTFSGFSYSLRQKYVHKADISNRAIERLTIYFNNLIAEIHF